MACCLFFEVYFKNKSGAEGVGNIFVGVNMLHGSCGFCHIDKLNLLNFFAVCVVDMHIVCDKQKFTGFITDEIGSDRSVAHLSVLFVGQELGKSSCCLVKEEESFRENENDEPVVIERCDGSNFTAVGFLEMMESLRFRVKTVDAASVGSNPNQSVIVLIGTEHGTVAETIAVAKRHFVVGVHADFFYADEATPDCSCPHIVVFIFIKCKDGIEREGADVAWVMV